MTRSEKTQAIELLKEKFSENDFFYLADSSTLSVSEVSNLRRKCFEQGVEMKVVKNTLAQKALESLDSEKGYEALFDQIKGPTSIFFTKTANLPAKIIKEFRKKHERPVLKAAYIDTAVYVGDNQLDALLLLKSKEELIADVILLLESPINDVLGSLQSGADTISGLLITLEEKSE